MNLKNLRTDKLFEGDDFSDKPQQTQIKKEIHIESK
jgi:hypothetical protein